MPRPKKKTPAAPGGRAKAQRHDLVMPQQAPAAPTNMQYGAHAESIASQKAMPLPATSAPGGGTPSPTAPGGGGGDPVAAALAMQPPGPPLSAASNRPGEPLSHGAPFGAGAGPEVLGLPTPGDDVQMKMEALYRAYPIREIAELLAEMTD